MELETDALPETATPYQRWEAGELAARDAAMVVAQELIREIEPAEQALEARKKARREELGTLLIRVGEPLEVLGRVTRWVEPTPAETASVKRLRALLAFRPARSAFDELRDQGAPELDSIAARIDACITVGDRRGYPLLAFRPARSAFEPPPRPKRDA